MLMTSQMILCITFDNVMSHLKHCIDVHGDRAAGAVPGFE